MLNHCIPLGLLALVATIRSMPAPVSDDFSDHNKTGEYDDKIANDFSFNSDHRHLDKRTLRTLHNIIDGTLHRIKAVGATYRQRTHDGQCAVEYDGKLLSESSVIQIRRKLYRVEDCLLERVFHACGPNLLLMLNVVCRVVEKHQTTTMPTIDFRRQTIPPSVAFLHRLRPRANKTPRVITESCCENLCTISELTRYCHRWDLTRLCREEIEFKRLLSPNVAHH